MVQSHLERLLQRETAILIGIIGSKMAPLSGWPFFNGYEPIAVFIRQTILRDVKSFELLNGYRSVSDACGEDGGRRGGARAADSSRG